jgi:Glycoside-hydrolase family GH114
MGSVRPRRGTFGLLRAAVVLPALLSLVLVPVATGLASARTPAKKPLPAPVPCNASAGACWQPNIHARWQYQLQGSPDGHGGCLYKKNGFINIGVTGRSFATGIRVAPTVFDLDILQDGKCYSPQNYAVLNYAAVQAIHVRGARVVGYMSAGTGETWRPDFPEFQAFDQSCDGCLFGNPDSGYPDEYWLNINSDVFGTNPNTGKRESAQAFLLDEMLARVKEAKLIGVDAIEFDNTEEYDNNTGLKISPWTQLQYDTRLANLAHRMGLTVALKNDIGQAEQLIKYFDFEINEQCWQYGECDGLAPWPAAGKAVFNVEYGGKQSKYCPKANSAAYDFNSIGKTDDLYDLPYSPCR